MRAGDDRKNLLLLGDILGLVGCLTLLVVANDLSGEVRGIIATIAGVFSVGLRDAHTFEFGSSRGSQEKTEMMAKR